MMAGSCTSCIAAAPRKATQFLCFRSPVSSSKVASSHARPPLSRLSSSCLVPLEMPRRESVDFWKLDSAFSSLFLTVEGSFDLGGADGLGKQKISSAPWNILEAGEGEDRKQSGVFSVPSIPRDASLQYANVMWFKGPYNAEIICGEDESGESLVRRFRQAVSRAGVIRECRRRRYRESPQDTIKRKQQTAAVNRRRSRLSSKSNTGWTQNAWKLSTQNLKPVDHNAKKKSSRKSYSPSRFDATKKDVSDTKTDDIDDDYWGYAEEVEEPGRASHR